MMGKNLASRLSEMLSLMAERIADYLSWHQREDGTFPARDFYGKGFSALLWSHFGDRYGKETDLALKAIEGEPKSRTGPGKYHFEFNRFALAKMGLSVERLNDILQGERYADTTVANWMLLRAWCRLVTGHRLSRLLGRGEVVAVLFWFRSRGGVIEDQRKAFTSQYHAYCVALLGELDRDIWKGKNRRIQRALIEGADVIAALVLPGGQCNYMGRGSLQSFGYAAAILAFAHAFRTSQQHKYLLLIEEVASYLSSYQRKDGSIPLVLSTFGRVEGPPDKVDQSSPAYAGWYTYNNFYDYLPFTGALLMLAHKILKGQNEGKETDSIRVGRDRGVAKGDVTSLGRDIKVIRSEYYVAVVSAPNRIWASSQPLPYLAVRGTYPLPCYGGEQDGPGPYTLADLPLPTFWIEGKKQATSSVYYCDPSSYRWISEHTMRGRWLGGEHYRTFIWKESKYEVVDRVTYHGCISGVSIVRCNIIRLPLPEHKVKKVLGNSLEIGSLLIAVESDWQSEAEPVYSPEGPLTVYCNSVVVGRGCAVSAKHVVSMKRC